MNKTAIITGADGGMGYEITKAVAAAGYHVIMICYTSIKGEEKKSRIILDTGNNNIEVIQSDLSSMECVLNTVNKIKKRTSSVELLMNNAGVMCTHYTQTNEGFEYTVAVNYLAPYLLTRKLLPLMHKGSRIVNMVSCTYLIGKIDKNFFTKGRKGDFWRIPIYSNTKLALWLFTRKLSEILKSKDITVNAADPGIVSTNIIRMDKWFDPLTDVLFRPLISSPRKGADTAIKLLLDGKYKNISGYMFTSSKKKNLKDKYNNHPQMDELWENTEKILLQYLENDNGST